MAIEYLGLSEINGPLIALEGVKDAALMKLLNFQLTMAPKSVSVVLLKYMKTKRLFRFLRVLKVCPLQIPILS